MATDQRSKRFVDPAVQGALSRRLILHWVVFLMVSASCALLVQFLSDPFRPLSVLIQQMWWTQGPVLMVGVCLLPVFVLDTIKLSHRFAGPLVRIRSVIVKAGHGETVQPIKLRPDDFWHDFAAEVNIVLDRLNRSQAAIREYQADRQDARHEMAAT
jgi:hypothetical protein